MERELVKEPRGGIVATEMELPCSHTGWSWKQAWCPQKHHAGDVLVELVSDEVSQTCRVWSRWKCLQAQTAALMPRFRSRKWHLDGDVIVQG